MIELKANYACSCGKCHSAGIDEYLAESGAIRKLPKYLQRYNAHRVMLVADVNTYQAAGQKVGEILSQAGYPFTVYVFPEKNLKPDERAVGSLMMHFDPSCDMIVGVGSGVINDLCKILANITAKPFFIVATAPSMDGYASQTASMERDGVKASIPARCANMIFGDLDILCKAPNEMLLSGLGDMLAKYISIADWRVANIVVGEYYCEEVAAMVRSALAKCVSNAEALLQRGPEAVGAVFEGLVLSGIAMNYAGLSRPASGVEHYFSHIWDMRALEFGTPVSTHGIQCALGTLYAARIYKRLAAIHPDSEMALAIMELFDYSEYSEFLRKFLGKAGETLIALEQKEGKYNKDAHAVRVKTILQKYDEIISIVDEEVPELKTLEALFDLVGLPKSVEDIGLEESIVPLTFRATKDIRDKYVLSRLVFDLGLTII